MYKYIYYNTHTYIFCNPQLVLFITFFSMKRHTTDDLLKESLTLKFNLTIVNKKIKHVQYLSEAHKFYTV